MSGDEVAFRCGANARLRDDSLIGTAAPASSWLLVEQPGPWPRRAFEDSPLDPAAGAGIAERARVGGTRPLFIRRHGRRETGQRFAYVDAAAGEITWRDHDSLADILTAPWTSDSPVTQPLYLVCTHGRHDRCCAIAGRPVAAQLGRMRADQTWECSHLGGDRFAGNVLVLPWGVTYGFVDPLDVPAIVSATERGEVHLPLLRGYSTDGPVGQTARITAQTELGRPGVHDLPVIDSRPDGPDRWIVRLADGRKVVTVVVEQRRAPDARATCAHRSPVRMRELHATVTR